MGLVECHRIIRAAHKQAVRLHCPWGHAQHNLAEPQSNHGPVLRRPSVSPGDASRLQDAPAPAKLLVAMHLDGMVGVVCAQVASSTDVWPCICTELRCADSSLRDGLGAAQPLTTTRCLVEEAQQPAAEMATTSCSMWLLWICWTLIVGPSFLLG